MIKSDSLVQNKSLLAKLLATENIHIQHLNVSTAGFNLKTRTLTCPIWKEMSGDLYDLFMGHEIGHALYTPMEEWEKIQTERKSENWGYFLNVCEDARIEKFVKRKYPGIKKPFINAYKHLYFERDFFGVEKRLQGNISKLKLIDKINIFFKCGSSVPISFTEEEQVFVDELFKAETFDDVIVVTDKLWAYAKEKQKEEKEQKQQNQESTDSKKKEKSSKKKKSEKSSKKEEKESDDSSSDEKDEGEDTDSDESETSESEADLGEESESSESSEDGEENSDSSEDENDDNEELEDSNTSGESEGSSGSEEPEPESITQKSLKEREEELVDTNADPYIFLEIPEYNLEEIIVDQKMVVDFFESKLTSQMIASTSKLSYKQVSDSILNRFNRKHNSYISLLVKEFEMRKNARAYERQLESKTGELDTRKLHRYKFSSDIFRKISEVQKGKSHGMIMFVDLSASMKERLAATLEQTLILCVFCRRVGIPFEVYGFSDQPTTYLDKSFSDNSRKFIRNNLKKNVLELNNNNFHLKSFINSKLNGRDFQRASAMMLNLGYLTDINEVYKDLELKSIYKDFSLEKNSRYLSWDNYEGTNVGNIVLNGTPFIETLIASKNLIKKFQRNNQVDIMNVVYLTDGEGDHRCLLMPENYEKYSFFSAGCNITYVDPDTRLSVEVEKNPRNYSRHQTAITQLIEKCTGCRHIAFFIGNMRSFENKFKDSKKSLEENGFIKVPSLGYKSYYYVDVKENDKEVNQTMSNLKYAEQRGSDIGGVFQEKQKLLKKNRAIATSFCKEIAVESTF